VKKNADAYAAVVGSGQMNASLPQAVDKDIPPTKCVGVDSYNMNEKENINPLTLSSTATISDSTINTNASTNEANAGENDLSSGMTLPEGQQITVHIENDSVQSKSTCAPLDDHAKNSVGGGVMELINNYAIHDTSPSACVSDIPSQGLTPKTTEASTSPLDTMASLTNSDNDEAINPYIAMRELRIARNQKRLSELGLWKPPPPPKQKPISKKPQQHTEPIRRSSRPPSQKRPPIDEVWSTRPIAAKPKRICGDSAGKPKRIRDDTADIVSSDTATTSPKILPSASTTLSDPQKLPTLAEIYEKMANSSKSKLRALRASKPKVRTVRPSKSKVRAAPAKRQQLYSIHRFLISDTGMIGINVCRNRKNQVCFINQVLPSSVAAHHGVQVDDEIIVPPKSASIDIYDLFVKATIQRPLLFEVKRPYNKVVPPKKLELSGPHSLHRFVINETGTLGVTLQQNSYSATTTTVVSIKPNSLGDIYGLRENDVICEPLDSVVASAQSDERPWILQVWRAVRTKTEDHNLSEHVQAGCSVENPFIFSFPIGNHVSKNQTEEMAAEDEVACSIREGDDDEGNTAQGDGLAAIDKGIDGSEVIVIDDDDDSAIDKGNGTEVIVIDDDDD